MIRATTALAAVLLLAGCGAQPDAQERRQAETQQREVRTQRADDTDVWTSRRDFIDAHGRECTTVRYGPTWPAGPVSIALDCDHPKEGRS